MATGLIVIFYIISEAGVPDDFEVLKWFGYFCLAVIALSIVIGSLMSIFRLPTLRRKLEAQVLRETGAQLANPDAYPQVRNLLDGLALSAGVPAPRFAVIQDAVPNSFGVGTRPNKTIIGITSGLVDELNRDELEAALSYEISRIGSWDIALSSWAVALTSGAIANVEADDLRSIVGWIPGRMAEWLQAWALRDQGEDRDRDRRPVHPAPRGPDHRAGEAGGRPGRDPPGEPGHRPAVARGARRGLRQRAVVAVQALGHLAPPPAAHRPADRAGRATAAAEGGAEGATPAAPAAGCGPGAARHRRRARPSRVSRSSARW